LAKTGNKPNLALSFNYQLGNGIMPYVDQLRGNWTATVAAAYPVFDGSRTRSQVAQAMAALQQARGRKEELKQAITMEIESDIADIQTLEQKLEIEKIKIGHAEAALNIAAERFQNALINTTDLIEAQNSLAGARLNDLQLVYNHILAQYNLYRAIGQTLFD
jgi:outer membrane protein TolC